MDFNGVLRNYRGNGLWKTEADMYTIVSFTESGPDGKAAPLVPPQWVFEELNGQHGHRCSVCGDWVNYDVQRGTCKCERLAPHNPLNDRIRHLESVLGKYMDLTDSLTSLIATLSPRKP